MQPLKKKSNKKPQLLLLINTLFLYKYHMGIALFLHITNFGPDQDKKLRNGEKGVPRSLAPGASAFYQKQHEQFSYRSVI